MSKQNENGMNNLEDLPAPPKSEMTSNPDASAIPAEARTDTNTSITASGKAHTTQRKEDFANVGAGSQLHDQFAREERREPRRLRDQASSDRRKGKKDSGQNLFRIREIFEGATRPD
jgi:hypothetical protein